MQQLMDLPGLTLLCVTAGWAGFAALAPLDYRSHEPVGRFGGANRVTLLRGSLAALLCGGLAVPLPEPTLIWTVAGLAALALALDGFDGWLARRLNLSSPYGARFDMETDTFLTFVLALLLWRWGEVGAWVLLLPLLRPVFVLAARFHPWLAAPLPFSQRRRLICVVQLVILAAGLTPPIQPPLTGFAVGAALVLLLFSFAVDTVWLFRHRTGVLSA